MARIRTVKPEMFESESLAECSVTAMLTFVGLLTQADDSGRHRDHSAIIAGRLWALRPDHTPTHVAHDLEELAAAGLVCRYTGCDGRTWLHIVKWDQHQRINKPTASRLPRCTAHEGSKLCGKCQKAPCPGTAHRKDGASVSREPTGGLREDYGSAPDGLQRPAAALAADGPRSGEPTAEPVGSRSHSPVDSVAGFGKTAGQTPLPEGSGSATGGVREEYGPGSRILDPGSVPTGREAHALDASSGQVSAKDLVAEYAGDCKRRPPSSTLGHLGREIKNLLEEDFSPGDIRRALTMLRTKGLSPSVLPSLVNQVVNAAPPSTSPAGASASGAGPWASTASSYTPYLNPATAPTTFGGSL